MSNGSLSSSPQTPDLRFASPDLRHLILSTCRALTPDATEAVEEGGCKGTPGARRGSTGGCPSLPDRRRLHSAATGKSTYFYYVGGNGSLYLRHGETDTLIAAAVGPGSFSEGV